MMKAAFVCSLVILGGCGEVLPPDTQLALCVNGLDDEGAPDSLVDCEDPRCAEISTCVPLSDDRAGIVVAEDEACPAGFEGGETVLYRGLQPGACEGCGCEVGTTTCTGKLWLYSDSNAC